MSHEGRVSRNSSATTAEHVSRDGVASAAGASALVLSFDRPEIVRKVEDPDAFDAEDSILYQPMICDDCGNDRFRNNKCMTCGSVAPWAAKLGCGLA